MGKRSVSLYGVRVTLWQLGLVDGVAWPGHAPTERIVLSNVIVNFDTKPSPESMRAMWTRLLAVTEVLVFDVFQEERRQAVGSIHSGCLLQPQTPHDAAQGWGNYGPLWHAFTEVARNAPSLPKYVEVSYCGYAWEFTGYGAPPHTIKYYELVQIAQPRETGPQQSWMGPVMRPPRSASGTIPVPDS